MRVSLIGCLLVAAELGLIYFYSEAMGNNDVKAVYEAGVYLVSGQLFLLLAARRAIKKDDMLVKAADRIR